MFTWGWFHLIVLILPQNLLAAQQNIYSGRGVLNSSKPKHQEHLAPGPREPGSL